MQASSAGVDPEVTKALRDQSPLPKPRLQALSSFTCSLLEQDGRVEPEQVQAFIDAGYSQTAALEVIVGVAQKVVSNLAANLAQLKAEGPLKEFDWGEES